MDTDTSSVKNVAEGVKKTFDGMLDYAKNNPESTAVIALASVTILHEIGYFIRSIKM
jgi:hypothetical protein